MDDAVLLRVNEHRADEAGRGRTAEQPHHIPWLGWKDILFRLRKGVARDRIGTIAAGTTFFLLLSLVPSLAALVSLYGLVADPVTIGDHLALLRGYLPPGLLDLVEGELHRLTANRSSTLGLGFIVGVLVALWSANSGMKALLDSLNVAYGEMEKRSFLKLLGVSISFTLGAIVFFAVALNLMIGVPLVIRFLPLGPIGDLLLAILPVLLMFAAAVTGLAMLYRFGPSRAEAKWRWVTPGSLAAAILWLIGSILFSWYVSRWSNYSATYGSLGTLIGVLMWIYLSMWVVLIGAELNAQIEHQTAQDTTLGPDRPLGERGAFMADHVGASQD